MIETLRKSGSGLRLVGRVSSVGLLIVLAVACGTVPPKEPRNLPGVDPSGSNSPSNKTGPDASSAPGQPRRRVVNTGADGDLPAGPKSLAELRGWTEPAGPGVAWLAVGETIIRARVAAVPEAREKGLGGVASLPDFEGMIFLYPRSESRSFWMKDCLMALDIAYVDSDRRITQVGTLPAPQVGAAGVPRLPSRKPARYVFEMRAGWFRDHGLGPGSMLTFSTDLESWVALVAETQGSAAP